MSDIDNELYRIHIEGAIQSIEELLLKLEEKDDKFIRILAEDFRQSFKINFNEAEREQAIKSIDSWLEINANGNAAQVRDIFGLPHPQLPALFVEEWEIYSLHEAYKPREPVKYIVDGLFSLPSLSIVYGPPGALKSMLLADMCVCVANGEPWLPPLPKDKGPSIRTLHSPILWIDFDNGKLRTDQRFDALGKARDVPENAPIYYVSMPSPWLDSSAKKSIEDLADRIRKLKVRLVVIDNLGVTIGKADENSAEMATVMAHLRWLAEKTGSAVIIIHHQRKSNGVNSRSGETLRGHSSIEAAIDLGLLVEREELSQVVTIKSTKTRGLDVYPFSAQFAYEHNEHKELIAAKFFGFEIDDLTSDRAIEREILSAVSEMRMSKKGSIVDKVKSALSDVGLNRIRTIIDRMVSGGKISCIEGGRGAKFYDLPL